MTIFSLRKSGCPNCTSDNVAEVWSAEDFKTFEPLRPRGKLGKSTELFECSNCKVHYIRVNNGHLLHLLTKSSEELVFKFFDAGNHVTQKDAEVLRNIGSPRLSEGNEEYPAKVLTKDGTPLRAFLKTPLPVHPLPRASEEGDSWANTLKGEISKAIADFPPQANTALPAAFMFFDAFMSELSVLWIHLNGWIDLQGWKLRFPVFLRQAVVSAK